MARARLGVRVHGVERRARVEVHDLSLGARADDRSAAAALRDGDRVPRTREREAHGSPGLAATTPVPGSRLHMRWYPARSTVTLSMMLPAISAARARRASAWVAGVYCCAKVCCCLRADNRHDQEAS
jgi:hypothetical protein